MNPAANILIRRFDPDRDSIDDLSRLNDWAPEWQAWWAKQLRLRFHIPHNYLVVEAPTGELVGVVLLLDAGLPMMVVEGAYVKPEWRSYRLGRRILQAIDAEAKARRVPLVLSHVPKRIGKAMRYFGYKAMNDEGYSLFGRLVEA